MPKYFDKRVNKDGVILAKKFPPLRDWVRDNTMKFVLQCIQQAA